MVTADELVTAQRRYCERMAEAGRAYREIAGPARTRFDKAAAQTRMLGPKELIPQEDVAVYLSAMHRADGAFRRIFDPAVEEIDAVLAERTRQADAAAGVSG
ncbi:MAG: hypothetical protein JWO67_6383 [Streptosporangiaceae bacterium]|nr:hypothetical protein [Streptosporangiaceae bacterium]